MGNIDELANRYDAKIAEAADMLGLALQDGLQLGDAVDFAKTSVLTAEIVSTYVPLTGEEKFQLACKTAGKLAERYDVDNVVDTKLEEIARMIEEYDVPGFPDTIIDAIFPAERIEEGLKLLKKLVLGWLIEQAHGWLQRHGWLGLKK